ncbi:hypothetical protein PDK27_28780, partial [Bacillus cereus group sp. TH230-1LC]|nr:hypothetical protein [Bacillus cereus group sp. TH230-1LC]
LGAQAWRAIAAFLFDFLFAGRVSPRQATSFLARARKDAKKACCAAFAPQNSLRAALRRCARTTAVSQTGCGVLVMAAAL